MAKPWFRLYAEFLSDPKMQLLAFEDQRHYVGVLCLKCNGTLETLSIGPEHFERMVSKALGLDPIMGAEVKRRLMDVGLIGEGWQPIAWDRRQYESDSSTARVHKWREERTRNVTETLQQRSRSDSEQIQNRTEQSKKGRAKRAPSGRRLPEDWILSPECEEFARTLGLDPAAEFHQFRDYWLGVPGSRGVKADWDATWRNSCRRSASRPTPGPGRREDVSEMVARLRREADEAGEPAL